ncbi:MAG TPA: GNAT family N-acetyltransferase [Rubricoccaceae bacterium]|nr:GNAT family N-acetyltransferase [Rubricoccaceae bacterium]
MATVRLLGAEDAAILDHVAPDVFDHAVDPRWAADFFADPRHHLAVALDENGCVVGIASAFHYVHPDKPPALFVNEVGVAPTHQRQGIGKQLLAALFEHGRALGCTEAWLGTEVSNAAARALYAAAGMNEDPEPFVLYTITLNPDRAP